MMCNCSVVFLSYFDAEFGPRTNNFYLLLLLLLLVAPLRLFDHSPEAHPHLPLGALTARRRVKVNQL